MREMSKDKSRSSITAEEEATKIVRAAGELHAQVRIVKFDDDVPEILWDTPIPSGWTKQKLGKEVLPPLKQALDDAGDQGIDLIMLRHGDRTDPVERKAPTPTTITKMRRVQADLIPALSTGELAEKMLPEVPVPSPAQALLAQRESEARWSLLEEFGAWTSEQIADNRSRAKNRHALANRWRAEGKVFSIEFRGQRLFPGFQFDAETYAPEPVVATVLGALPREEMSDWEIALWWTTANDQLGWRRPVDMLDEEPEALAAVAARLAEPAPL